MATCATQWVALVLLVLLGGAAGNALALPVPPDNTVYGNVGTTLYTITPSTGAAVSVGTFAFSTNGFGRDPITGRVYYAEAALPGRVAYWDPTTATNTILPTSLGFVTNRMGFRADVQMFSMNPGTNNIYVIDRNTGNPTGITFIANGVALGSPSTGIVDLGLSGGFTNARGANGYADLGAMPKFADIAISVTPSSSNFARTGSASYAVGVVNNGPQSASGNFTVTFTLPAGLTLVGAGPFGTGWSCVGGPAVTCTNTTSSLVVGAALPTLNVPVTTSVAGGTNSVATTFTVADTTFDSVTSNNATTVTVGVGAATIAKTFLTNPMPRGGTSTLVLTLSNPTATAFTGVSFTDTLPTAPGAMVVATVPNFSTSGCGTPSFTPSAGAASPAFSTASVAVGATCRVSVDVVVPTVGSNVNTSSTITSTNGGTGNTASATLTAVALNVQTLTKSFASNGPIGPGTPNALTLTLGNSNASAITLSAAMVDNLPSGMLVASPANSSGTCVGVTATPGDTRITLTNGSSIAAGGCTVIANVVASTGGTFTNTLAAGALVTSAGSNAAPASASFSVPFAPAATKSVTPATVAVGATSVLKITLVNSNASTAVSGAAFTDTYPAGLVNTATPAATISGAGCSGTVTGAANGTSLSLSGGVIPSSGSCDITVNVSSASAATGSQRHRVDRMDPDRRAAAQRLGAGHVHGSSQALRPTRQQRRHNHGDCGCTMPPTSAADLNPRGPSRGKVECWDRSIARVTAAGAHGAIGAAV